MALELKIIACENSVTKFTMVVKFLSVPTIRTLSSLTIGLKGVLYCIAIT